MKYCLICMSFDGEYVTEGRDFKSVGDAWDRSGDMGSRWFFYPFHFVTTGSGKTVKDAPDPLKHLEGLRVKQVAVIFNAASKDPETNNLGAEDFAYVL